MNQPRGSWPTGQTRQKILTVEDDPSNRLLTQTALEKAGYEVWPAASAEEALQILDKRGLPHLALFDINLPGLSGLKLAHQIQEYIDLPIIMLTSVEDPKTVVGAIDDVAEDYIRKERSNPSEIVARVRRLLRRIGDYNYTLDPMVRIDDRLSVEFAKRQVIVEGKRVDLTPTETKLLYILMRSAGRPVQTDYLLRRLWPMQEVFEEALRTHVYRLRQKIEISPKKPRYVLTLRGLGYKFPQQKAGKPTEQPATPAKEQTSELDEPEADSPGED